MATQDASLPMFDHTHDALTTVGVIAFTALTAVWASWLTADLGLRWPVLVLAAVGSGYLLYDQSTRRSVLSTGLYLVAALVVLTPIMFVVPLMLAAGRPGVESPWMFVVTVADLQAFLTFLVVAAVPAVAGYVIAHPEGARARLSTLTGGVL